MLPSLPTEKLITVALPFYQRFGVRLEDRSDQACDVFARDVRRCSLPRPPPLADHLASHQVKISGFHPVGAQNSGGFVVFDIEIHTRQVSLSSCRPQLAPHDLHPTQNTLIKAHKRYSAFVRLRSELIDAFPQLKALIPRLPPKSSLGERSSSAVQSLNPR